MAFIHKTSEYKKYELESITTEQGRRYKVPGSVIEYESMTTALSKRPEKIQALKEWRQRVQKCGAFPLLTTSLTSPTWNENMR